MSLNWSEYNQPGSDEAYVAFTKRGRYNIYQWKDRWDIRRTDHVLLPPFEGSAPDLETAKLYCEHDLVKIKRADKWLDYMLDNDPPNSTVITIAMPRGGESHG